MWLDFKFRGLPVVNQTLFVEEGNPVTLTALGAGARDLEFVRVTVSHEKDWGKCAVLNVQAGKTVGGKEVIVMNPSISACDGSPSGESEGDGGTVDVLSLDTVVETVKN